MTILKHHEAVAFAAVLQRLRDGGALPVRRPSYQQPTYRSRPINETRMPLVPPGPDWVTVLQWSAPPQYISVITGYVATVAEALSAPDCLFRMMINGTLAPGVSIGVGANLFYTGAPPLVPRSTHIAISPTSTFQLQMRNPTLFPRTAMCAIFGWSYDTINLEFGTGGAEGVNDA